MKPNFHVSVLRPHSTVMSFCIVLSVQSWSGNISTTRWQQQQDFQSVSSDSRLMILPPKSWTGVCCLFQQLTALISHHWTFSVKSSDVLFLLKSTTSGEKEDDLMNLFASGAAIIISQSIFFIESWHENKSGKGFEWIHISSIKLYRFALYLFSCS